MITWNEQGPSPEAREKMMINHPYSIARDFGPKPKNPVSEAIHFALGVGLLIGIVGTGLAVALAKIAGIL